MAIKRRKWEYRIVDIPGAQQTKKWRQYSELLNELGQEGWELVSSADRRTHLKARQNRPQRPRPKRPSRKRKRSVGAAFSIRVRPRGS